MARKKKNKRNRYRSRYQSGGMYSDNTVAAAGQGNRGSTSNIVYQEKDPRLQEERLKALEEERKRLSEEGQEATKEITSGIELDKQKVALAAQQQKESMKAPVTAMKSLEQGIKKTGVLGSSVAPLSSLGITPAGYIGEAGRNIFTGVGAGSVEPAFSTYGEALKAGWGSDAAQTALGGGAPTTLSTAGQVGGAGVGTGVGKFLTSGPGIGMALTAVGEGTKALSDDKDPTTYKAGEVAGSVLSRAGTGASVGSMFGPAGTAIGGIAGGIYGGIEGLAARNIARRSKRSYAEKRKQEKEKYNKETQERLGTQMSLVRSGQLKGKTYSGYDVGRNVVAKLGGMRMGVPRYGNAI